MTVEIGERKRRGKNRQRNREASTGIRLTKPDSGWEILAMGVEDIKNEPILACAWVLLPPETSAPGVQPEIYLVTLD